MLRLLAWVVALLLIVAVGARVGLWLFFHVILGLGLHDQPTMVQFPPTTFTTAVARNKVRIKLDGYIDAIVPFKQELSLPLVGHYDSEAKFVADIPVAFTINYRGAIPVNSMATIHGVTDFTYQKVKRLRNVAFTAEIPLKFEQPVTLTVPVKATLHIAFQGPLGVDFNQTIVAPVDTVLKTRLLAVREIETPILARFGLNVHWPDHPIPVIIADAPLRMKVSTLRLEKAGAPGDPPAAPQLGEEHGSK